MIKLRSLLLLTLISFAAVAQAQTQSLLFRQKRWNSSGYYVLFQVVSASGSSGSSILTGKTEDGMVGSYDLDEIEIRPLITVDWYTYRSLSDKITNQPGLSLGLHQKVRVQNSNNIVIDGYIGSLTVDGFVSLYTVDSHCEGQDGGSFKHRNSTYYSIGDLKNIEIVGQPSYETMPDLKNCPY